MYGKSVVGACLNAIVVLGLSAALAGAAEEDDANHATMDHSQHNMGRDEIGRSLYGMKHTMDPAMTKELREKVALYKDYTDAQIALSMDMMGAEYAWYISPPELKGSAGRADPDAWLPRCGRQGFPERMQPIGNIFPTSLGIGMAMMMSSHIQVALDDLKAAGAKEVVVVPVMSTDDNELYRQWLYIFGLQDKPEYRLGAAHQDRHEAQVRAAARRRPAGRRDPDRPRHGAEHGSEEGGRDHCRSRPHQRCGQ